MTANSTPTEKPREEPQDEAADHLAALAGVIRNARRGRYSVNQLARRAGVSAGLLSELERGRGNPSLGTLLKLARALDLPFSAFFPAPRMVRRMVVRRDERLTLVLPPRNGQEALSYELLTPDFEGDLALIRTRLPGNWSMEGQLFSHPGEESVHVLVGRVEARVGTETHDLAVGDTITYNATLPHMWRNPARDAAQILTAMTPPTGWYGGDGGETHLG